MSCISQMILARAANIKSGWKPMISVFQLAAKETDGMVLALFLIFNIININNIII